MLDNVTGIGSLIVTLSVLVIVHEWGHFIVAKLFGMRVEDFSLFFGPRLVRLGKRGDTEYNIRCVPLGGFVRIAGMDLDDVSGGRPILDAIRNPRFDDPHGLHRMIRELDSDSLGEVDADNVTRETRALLRTAIGAEGLLTDRGREELESAQASPARNEDERKLIQLVLMADSRAKDPGLYSQKPLYQRALTIFAGPFMSLLFGYLVFVVMGITVGLPNESARSTNQVQVLPNTRASHAGLHTGDIVTAINGVPTPDSGPLTDIIHHSEGKHLVLEVRRDGATIEIPVTPGPETFAKFDPKTGKAVLDAHGHPKTETLGVIGIFPSPHFERHNVRTALVLGTRMTRNYLYGLMYLFRSFRDIRENVSGPIGIAQASTVYQRLGAPWLVMMGACLSLCLGIMNLLPIPVLDGGHLLLLLVEKVWRRRLTPREVYRAQMVGLAVIATIAVLVMFNDISRIVTHRGLQ